MFARRQSQRFALVPNQWSGSVQQYYHFLLGYLAPIVLWQSKSQVRKITVRDCGPMNRWFGVLPENLDVEVMNVGHFLHTFAGKLQPCVVLRGMDFPQEFNSRKIQKFRYSVLSQLGLSDLIDRDGHLNTVIDRVNTDPFYSTSESEIDMAGAQRRSVPNLGEWIDSVSPEIRLDRHEMSNMAVRDQVRVVAETRVLIGQHGAGLTNMVFMKPGGVVLEIHPPLPEEAVQTFSQLARACGHTYVQIPQAGVHAEIDFGTMTKAVKSFIHD